MQFMLSDAMGTPVWVWTGFLIFVIAVMVFDLGILNRKSHVIGVRESMRLYAFYVALGLAFGVIVWVWRGSRDAFLYLNGFVIEQSLSMDNIFVIAVILSYFAIPRAYQHRVLFYGILGVILLRGVMIFAGAAIVARFEWVLYVFAIFLVATGVKMLVGSDDGYDVSTNPVLRFMRRHFRITDGLRGERFVVREADKSGRARLHITPLLVALCVIEVADVIFAVDSIPAIFAITTDPFIVFTSNIFAVLGLRALFFALAALLHRLAYLKYALSLVLVFIGSKILIADLFGIEHIPPGWSLGITLSILGGGAAMSIWKTSRDNRVARRQRIEEARHAGAPLGGASAPTVHRGDTSA